METHTTTNKFPPAMLWVIGIAIVLFCGAGIGAIMGWIPTSIGSTPDKPVLEKQSATTVKPHTAPTVVANNTHPVVKCADCGVIESVHEIDVKGEGSGLGAVGGAVVGGLIGNQVGGGRGKDAMTVVGAVGGGLAGNEIEKRTKSTKSFQITVRLDDGTTRMVTSATAPAWRIGEKVKVVNGVIESRA